MEILKQGKMPKHKIYKLKCFHCGTVFTYDDGDIRFDPSKVFEIFDHVTCPFCYHATAITIFNRQRVRKNK